MKEMKATLEEACLRRLDPHGYFQAFLDSQVRPDGRQTSEARAVEVSIGEYDASTVGSAKVTMDRTIVSVGITLQVGTPSHEAPKKGDIDVDISLGALCASKYERGADKAEDLASVELLLVDMLSASTVFDLKQLCIEKGQYAFRLKISGVCISHDGNLPDAFLLAAVVALMHSQLPGTKIENDKVVVDPTVESKNIILKQIPIPVTVGIFNQSLLLDPTLQEEEFIGGYVRAVFLDDGSIQHINQRSWGTESSGFGVKRYQEVIGMMKIKSLALRDSLKLHVVEK